MDFETAPVYAINSHVLQIAYAAFGVVAETAARADRRHLISCFEIDCDQDASNSRRWQASVVVSCCSLGDASRVHIFDVAARSW